jgi:hypothetical protein
MDFNPLVIQCQYLVNTKYKQRINTSILSMSYEKYNLTM